MVVVVADDGMHARNDDVAVVVVVDNFCTVVLIMIFCVSIN